MILSWSIPCWWILHEPPVSSQACAFMWICAAGLALMIESWILGFGSQVGVSLYSTRKTVLHADRSSTKWSQWWLESSCSSPYSCRVQRTRVEQTIIPVAIHSAAGYGVQIAWLTVYAVHYLEVDCLLTRKSRFKDFEYQESSFTLIT